METYFHIVVRHKFLKILRDQKRQGIYFTTFDEKKYYANEEASRLDYLALCEQKNEVYKKVRTELTDFEKLVMKGAYRWLQSMA